MTLPQLLEHMCSQDASDLFITPGAPPTLKCHGKMKPLDTSELTAEMARDFVFSLMTPEQQAGFNASKESNFAHHHRDLGRFRISAYYLRGDCAMVIRRVKYTIPSLKYLGLPETLKPLVMQKSGLVLLTGSTGMGKSTTMASLIHYRNQSTSGHIMSLEDPIEYLHKHHRSLVSQREIGIDTESYGVALKNALRQAPDMINIGEIRSLATIQYALSYAESGHLCLATFHASSALKALERWIQFFPQGSREQAWQQLALNLKGILTQRLLPSETTQKQVLAYELLINAPHVASHLARGQLDKIKEFMARKNQYGMQTLDQSLLKLFHKGEISEQEALAHADSKNDVRLNIKLAASETKPFMKSEDSGGLGLVDDIN